MIGVALVVVHHAGAVAQSPANREAAVAVVYGIAFGSSSGLYSDLVGLSSLPARTVLLAGISPRGELLVDGMTRLGSARAPLGVEMRFRMSGVDQNRFHGVGYRTPSDRPRAFYDVEQYRYALAPAAVWSRNGWRVAVGPSFELVDTDTDIDPGPRYVIGDPTTDFMERRPNVEVEDVGLMQLTKPYGSGRFTQLGLDATVDGAFVPTPGGPAVGVLVEGSVHPAVFGVRQSFTRVRGALSVRQSFPVPGEPTLAVSAKATKIWGTAPFFELAYLGGRSSLRGFPKHRFAGDASFGSQFELRVKLGSANVVRPFDFGVLGLADVGRVYLRGLSYREWHATHGGGVWVQPRNAPPITLSVARGSEGARVYLAVGWP
jgi:hypothetical protein